MNEYIVSARKYRPMTFDSVVGQHALTTTLKNAVKSGKLAHAYLFCGPRGVGKTTCARIFAKAINCENPTADGEACNECESCKAFNDQRSMNIFELDAASNNSVENIKQLMDQTRIPPQIGRYKVFIIDEVHMLSTAAFNSFLKTLEEPPAHVIFILATTEKQKILPTILSRCQIYDFERMNVTNTINHLKYVADKEGITYEEEALNVIAEKADGGMRDALSIFDQAASFCQGNITYDKVIEDLNVLDSDNYFRIIDLCMENKVSDIMVLLNNLINKGFDGGNLIGGLASHVRNVLMAKDSVTLPLLEVSERQRGKYQEQAKKCPTSFLYKALQILNNCDINYKQSRNKRLLIEITLIQVAQITQKDDDDSAGPRPANTLKPIFHTFLVKNNMTGKKQVEPVSNDSTPVITPVTRRTAATTANSRATASGTPRMNLSAISLSLKDMGEKQQDDSPVQTTTMHSQQTATPQQTIETDAKFTKEQFAQAWAETYAKLPQEESAMEGRMASMSPQINDRWEIEIEVGNEFAYNDFKRLESSILYSLRQKLSNQKITFTYKKTAQAASQKTLTRAEQFIEMGKKNPALLKLTKNLGLELA